MFIVRYYLTQYHFVKSHFIVRHFEELCIHISRTFTFSVEQEFVIWSIRTDHCKKRKIIINTNRSVKLDLPWFFPHQNRNMTKSVQTNFGFCVFSYNIVSPLSTKMLFDSKAENNPRVNYKLTLTVNYSGLFTPAIYCDCVENCKWSLQSKASSFISLTCSNMVARPCT